MDLTTIILTSVVLAVAAMVQASVGFAFALFSTPLLVWIGIPLEKVIIMVAAGSLTQSIFGVRRLHASVPWRQAWAATLLRILWLLAGLYILKTLIACNPQYIRFVVGAVLCVLAGLRVFWKPKRVASIHWIYTFLAFSASGLLAGITGMGGPPLVLWTMAHDWPNEKIRAFYFATFMTFIPIMIGLMCLLPWFEPLWGSLLAGLAFVPAIYLGSRVGLMLGERMSADRLHVLTLACLEVMGISAMVSAVVGG